MTEAQEKLAKKLRSKLVGASPLMRERLLARARAALPPEVIADLAAHVRVVFGCCGAEAPAGEAPGCFACGLPICAECSRERNGRGCPRCGAGRTQSGAIEVEPPHPDEVLVAECPPALLAGLLGALRAPLRERPAALAAHRERLNRVRPTAPAPAPAADRRGAAILRAGGTQ